MQGFMVPTNKINTKEIIRTGEGQLDKNEIMLCKQDAKWGWAERQGVSSYINHYMESFKWYIVSFFFVFFSITLKSVIRHILHQPCIGTYLHERFKRLVSHRGMCRSIGEYSLFCRKFTNFLACLLQA